MNMDKVKAILDGNHEKSDRKGHEKKKADMVSDGADEIGRAHV